MTVEESLRLRFMRSPPLWSSNVCARRKISRVRVPSLALRVTDRFVSVLGD